MKYKFLALFIGVLLALCTLSGCSCASITILTFSKDYLGGYNGIVTSYQETLTYQVTYANDVIKPLSTFESGILPTYNGELVTTLIKLSSRQEVKDICDSDLLEKEQADIYKFTTQLNLTVTHNCFKQENPQDVKIDGVNGTREDSIVSEVYFFSQDASFAPIYSKTTASYTLFNLNPTNPRYAVEEYTGETTYYVNRAEKIFIQDKTSTTSTNYTYKAVIDNAQLLFAVRNLNFGTETALALPTMSYQYPSTTNLAFRFNDTSTKDGLSISCKGNNHTSAKVKDISFNINSQNTSGAKQYFKVQLKDENSTLPYNSLLIQYDQPLHDYHSNQAYGGLQYKLTSVDISIN